MYGFDRIIIVVSGDRTDIHYNCMFYREIAFFLSGTSGPERQNLQSNQVQDYDG